MHNDSHLEVASQPTNRNNICNSHFSLLGGSYVLYHIRRVSGMEARGYQLCCLASLGPRSTSLTYQLSADNNTFDTG